MIYTSEDVILAAQEIKELIEGEKEDDTKFVLAELYAKAGTTDRARKLLTGYKKSLDLNTTKREYIKLVNKAIDLASTKRIKKFDWDEWWEQKREIGSIDGEYVSGNGVFTARKNEGR